MCGLVRIDNPFHTIDFHHHTLLKSDKQEDWDREMEADFGPRVRTMDASGINQAVLLPGNSLLGGGAVTDRAYNEFLAAYRARHGERFPYAFGGANPMSGKQALKDMEHAWGTLRLNGFVWHHRMYGMTINHPSMDPLWALAQEMGAPCAVHIFSESKLESPWRLQEIAERFPKVTFLALDGFSNADQSQWMPLIARHHPNIIFDTGALFGAGNFLDQFLRKIDYAPRLIFGSDYYPGLASHHSPAVIEILDLDAPDAVKEAILAKTLQKLLAR